MNITELENRYAELGAEIEALKAEEAAAKWPKTGDKFYYISVLGDIWSAAYVGSEYNQNITAIGNIYRTKAEAMAQVEAMKVVAELRACEGYEPFTNHLSNYCLNINLVSNSVAFDCWECKDSGWQSIYFASREYVKSAVTKVGADRILKAARWLAMREV